MKNNLIVLLCMLMSLSVFAQENAAYNAMVKQLSFEAPKYSKAAKGSPMLNEEMQTASLTLAGQEGNVELPMNLDLVNQLVAVQLEDGRTGYLSVDKVNTVTFSQDGQERTFQTMTLSDQKKPHFYQILKGGAFSLIKKAQKQLMASSRGGLYGFERDYLVKGPNSDYAKIRLNLEGLEKGLPKYANQIEAIAKEMGSDRILEKEVIEILTLLEQRS